MDRLMILGGSGLVGRALLARALADPQVGMVVAPARRALPAHPRLESPQVDFDHLDPEAPWWRADAVICALGTTRRAAGSREAFRRVDFDYPLACARLAQRHGAGTFVLTSASGAHPASPVFYPRTKGELEQALVDCGFASLTCVRPGLLGGQRDKHRPMERLALRVFGTLDPWLPRRLRIVPAGAVAACLLDAAVQARPGVHVIESDAIARHPGGASATTGPH